MDVKQEPVDLNNFIKIDSKSAPQTFKKEHGDVVVDTTFKYFEYQTTEQFTHVDKIKEEIIECEIPKIEDLLTKIEDTVFENVQTFPNTVKLELVTSGVKVTEIKQEGNEYILPKTESVVSEMLTSECDLPTLKIENTYNYPDNYLGHTYSKKPLKNTAPIVLKKKRRRYECPICQNNFPSSKSRSSHIDGHFEKRYAVCQFCGKLMKKSEFFQHYVIHAVKNKMKNHIDDVEDKSFKCGTCFKIFNLKYKFQKHLIIFHGEKPFICDICSKGFNRKCDLNRHLSIHSDKKPFKCSRCSKCFNNKSNLTRHLKIHSDKKPFVCAICFKGFKQKPHLRQHLTIHIGEKPFKCDICSKCFNTKSILQKHLIIHTGEKPFKCNKCSKGFTQKPGLQRHLLVHSGEKPFKCDICSKCFNRTSNLQKHLIIHSGEKPFKCDKCSKSFNSKQNLQRYLHLHLQW